MAKHLQFPAGSIITMTTGEYSDFGICGYVVTLKDCDLPALVKQYKAKHKRSHKSDDADPQAFPSWLIANGHCMPVETTEVHLGEYGRFDGELDPEGR